MLENSILYQAYCDQLSDINGKSTSMYSWMLHSQEQPLYDVAKNTQKLLSTKDWDAVRDEVIRVRVMERIEELKGMGKWSFLQPHKHRAPPRSKAHWDYLLDEMAWMHDDFAEERKLRIAMARMISSFVMDYHHAKDKSLYTVSAKKKFLPDYIVEDMRVAANDVVVPDTGLDDVAGHKHQTGIVEHVTDGANGQKETTSHAEYVSTRVKEEDLSQDEHILENNSSGEHTKGVDASNVIKNSTIFSEAPIDSHLLQEQPANVSEAQPLVLKIEEKLQDPQGIVGSGIQARRNSISNPSDDHVVPSNPGYLDGSASVYQLLAHISQQESIEDILGDSVYTLQQLNTLRPYGPAWDESYCDILDASPVVPICKTMWPDLGFSADDDGFGIDDNFQETVDIHDLVRFVTDDAPGWLGMEADSQGVRSIFTRNMMAPPLLPMFTQANKPPRNIHGTSNQPPADNAAQQSAIDACPGQAVFEWSPDRDKMLAKIVQQYTGNWPLITETFNHAFSLYGSRTLTSRSCYERWTVIKEDYTLDRTAVQTGFDDPEYGPRKLHSWSSQFTLQPTTAQQSAMQLAGCVVSHSETLKVVGASKKKRDSAPKQATVPPREIKPLPADQKVLTPAEMSKYKFEQDR
ncbi:chromatin modification- protein VID21, partial [Coemansia sp. RSA 1285]